MTIPADFDIPALQMRRGTDTAIMAYQAAEGEPIYNTTTKELRIGDGTTAGGNPILGTSGTYVFNQITATTATFVSLTVTNTATIGVIKLNSPVSAVTTQILYYNTSTKEVTYGVAPTSTSGTFTATVVVANTGTFDNITVRDTIQLGDYHPEVANNTRILMVYNTTTQGFTISNSPGFLGGGGGNNGINIGNYSGGGSNATVVGHQGLQGSAQDDTIAIGYRAGKGLFNVNQNNNTIIGNIITNEGGIQNNVIMTGTVLIAAGPDTTVNQRLRIGADRIILGKNGLDASVAANSIILNASGSTLTSANSGLFVNPITNNTSTQILYYNTSTKEITYGVASSSAGGVTSITAGTGTYISTSTGSITIWNTSTNYNQSLNTTDNVSFKSVQSTQTMSVGGYPVDVDGRSLLWNSNTQSSVLNVTNYVAGTRPSVYVRGYGQNRPGTVTTSTNGGPGIEFDTARGSTSTPYAVQSGDTLGYLTAGGYNGTRWASEENLMQGTFVFLATETFRGDATTTTNAGSRFFIRTQPQGVELNSTSRNFPILQSWTAGSTLLAPQQNLLFGTADQTTPTLKWSGTGAVTTATHIGHGQTVVQWINTNQIFHGVPAEQLFTFTGDISGTTMTVTTLTSGNILSLNSRIYSGANQYGFISAFGTATGGTGTYVLTTSSTVTSGTLSHGPDNPGLSETNYLMLVSNRRSGVSGRRNTLKNGDSVGQIYFRGQSTDSGTSVGSTAARIHTAALEDFSGSARGTKLMFQTVNSGTTTVTQRLELKDRENIYKSDIHSFSNAANSSNIATFNTTSVTLTGSSAIYLQSSQIQAGNGASAPRIQGQVGMYLSAAGSGVGAEIILDTGGTTSIISSGTTVATFTTASITVSAPINTTGLVSSTGAVVTGMNSSSTTYTLFSFTQTTYSGGKFVIKINDGTDRHMVEMMVTGDGTNVVYNEYAVLTNNGDLGTFDAVASGGDIVVRFTTKAGISNANARVVATLLV